MQPRARLLSGQSNKRALAITPVSSNRVAVFQAKRDRSETACLILSVAVSIPSLAESVHAILGPSVAVIHAAGKVSCTSLSAACTDDKNAGRAMSAALLSTRPPRRTGNDC